MDTVNSMVAQSKDFLRDAIKEVYEFLRKPGDGTTNIRPTRKTDVMN